MAESVTKLDFDPYEMLGVDEYAQEKDCIKAFRKQALKWHPDKNPEKKEYAQSMFLKLSKAFEILTDAAVRAAYDKLKQARLKAKQRHQHLDLKRRKLKEELASREAGAQKVKEDEITATKRLEKEIERLRKQGSSLLEREKEEIEKEVHARPTTQQETSSATTSSPVSPPRLRVKWKSEKSDIYDNDILESIFTKYGHVTAVVVSSKKKGSAIVEFDSIADAQNAVRFELGLPEHPLTVSWLDKTNNKKPQEFNGKATESHPCPTSSSSSTVDSSIDESLYDEHDFESIVLMKMRRAQERKKLIEQIEQNDNNDHIVNTT